MAQGLIFILALASALGSALMAGTFFAFSNFVMEALGRLPPASGAGAMQTINVTVLNPIFLSIFMGTAALAGILAVAALFRWSEPGALLLLLGCLSYILGTFLVTILFNVPLNEALAAADPAGQGGAELWKRYLADWTFWNTVRSLMATTALVAFVLAIEGRAHIPAGP